VKKNKTRTVNPDVAGSGLIPAKRSKFCVSLLAFFHSCLPPSLLILELNQQVTEVREVEYALNSKLTPGKNYSKDVALRKWLFEKLEGLSKSDLARLDLLRSTDDRTNVTQEKIVFMAQASTNPDGRYWPENKRKKEIECMKKIKDSHRNGAPDAKFKVGFVLPSRGFGESTTRMTVTIRQVMYAHIMHIFESAPYESLS